MNTIFSAQKQVRLAPRLSCSACVTFDALVSLSAHSRRQSIPLDACVLAEESSFLQQAAHLTGGVYLRPQRQAALSQYLLVRRGTVLRVYNC